MIEHEAVKESAVVPSPDSDRGQVVKAFVVLTEKYRNVLGDETQENMLKGWTKKLTFTPLTRSYLSIMSSSFYQNIQIRPYITESDRGQRLYKCFLSEQLQNYVKNSTAPYKYPRKIEFVESLPKTVSGKIRRTELRMKELKD